MVLLAYSLSMTLMSRVVQVLPMGVTYALWSGLGIVAIVLIGMGFTTDARRRSVGGNGVITAGVVLVNLSPATTNG